MKSAWILAIFAATLLVASANSQERTTPADHGRIDESSEKVKELRKERVAALEKMTEQLTALHKDGRVQYDKVLEAKRLLCEAKLDAAATSAERVELHKELVAVLKQHEELAEAERQSARGTEASVLKAKARRLEAEVQLEFAKMKLVNAGK